jgi:hypothetical protein
VVLAALVTAGLLVAARWSQANAAEKAPVVARLAPFFPLGIEQPRLRGEMPAPVFLTEEEARNVIIAEAKKADINFTPDVFQVEKVSIPDGARKEYGAGEKKTKQQITLVLDGTDRKRKISYEFVSEEDFKAWNQNKEQTFVESTLETAVVVREGLTAGMPEGTTALFYDPGYASKDDAKENLRKQVADFITWMKAQGAI